MMEERGRWAVEESCKQTVEARGKQVVEEIYKYN